METSKQIVNQTPSYIKFLQKNCRWFLYFLYFSAGIDFGKVVIFAIGLVAYHQKSDCNDFFRPIVFLALAVDLVAMILKLFYAFKFNYAWYKYCWALIIYGILLIFGIILLYIQHSTCSMETSLYFSLSLFWVAPSCCIIVLILLVAIALYFYFYIVKKCVSRYHKTHDDALYDLLELNGKNSGESVVEGNIVEGAEGAEELEIDEAAFNYL